MRKRGRSLVLLPTSPRSAAAPGTSSLADTASSLLHESHRVVDDAKSPRDGTEHVPQRTKRGGAAEVPLSSSSRATHNEGQPQPGTKRGRTEASDGAAGGPHRRHHRAEAGGGDVVAPGSSTSTAPAQTSRTLEYDVESPPHLGPLVRRGQHAEASPPSLLSVAPTPARRTRVLLTSTPLFIRQERAGVPTTAAAVSSGGGGGASASASMALLSTPLRLVRAARGLLSPAGASLRRRLASSSSGHPPAPTRERESRGGSRSLIPPSPWGRISSIAPANASLLSYPEDDRSDVSRRTASTVHGSSGAQAAASVSGSRRSSASGRGLLRGGGGGVEEPQPHRPTIQLDSVVLDDPGDEVTVSLSRCSSPAVVAVEEATTLGRSQMHGRPHIGGGGGRMGDRAALHGPCDVRFAQVSALSECLADIVSSSRSTAQSSLTSAAAGGAAALSSSATQSRLSSAGQSGTGEAGEEEEAESRWRALRRSATLMEPDVSPILLDAEELAIRRRLERRRALGPAGGRDERHTSTGVPTQRREDGEQQRGGQRRPPHTHTGTGNVMLLSVAPVPPPAVSTGGERLRGGEYARGAVPQRAASAAATGACPPPTRHRVELFGASSSPSPSPWRRSVARLCRHIVASVSLLLCVWGVAAVVLPLLALQPPFTPFTASAGNAAAAAELEFVHTHVNPIADLQALYQIAPASLDADAVARLHRRTLSEGVERLERATQHLAPNDRSPPSRRLFHYRAMIRAYLVLSRNCELYARSRDASRWRRYVGYPLADVQRYGVRRFGSFVSQPSMELHHAMVWRDRLYTTVACSAQSEALACPSTLYVEEAMARDAAQFAYTDVNEAHESTQRRRQLLEWRTRLHRDWSSEVYLETLLGYVRSGVQGLTRHYNT
ncbi:hypothetical protein NESM_000037500 [Novymonas esmeraldas]|uniref:Uncharacterized protein n=1 Tax=Novymonas esmeraldas TaxID=1808958 RepID=A0AAW0F2M8_9TRYP